MKTGLSEFYREVWISMNPSELDFEGDHFEFRLGH